MFRVPDFGSVFRVLGPGIQVPGFGFQVSNFGFYVSDFGFPVPDFGFPLPDFGFPVPDSGFQAPDFGFLGSGFRVEGTPICVVHNTYRTCLVQSLSGYAYMGFIPRYGAGEADKVEDEEAAEEGRGVGP